MDTPEHKLLLVEDSESDAYLVRRMLRESLSFIQYDFTTVPRLADAISLLDKEKFSAVLLDLNLVDSNGISSVSALHTTHPDIPIIVYSGSDDAHLQRQAILCGAKHYVVKGKESGFVIKFMIEQTIAA